MTSPGVEIDRALEDVSGDYAQAYFNAIHDLYVATVIGDNVLSFAAREELAEITAETMGRAEVLGATTVLVATAATLAQEGALMGRDRVGAMMFAGKRLGRGVKLKDAIADMVERTPKTLRLASERTAQAIAKLYSKGAVAAFVRAAEASVTKAAQAFIADAMKRGLGEVRAGKLLAAKINDIRKRSREWSEAYARMVFRTNVATATTAGRFRQTRDPDIRAVVPAFRFDAVGDSDTRDSHAAADGIILAVDHPAWAKIAPPLGYNCRCQVSHVSRMELAMMGRLDKRGNVIPSRIPLAARPDDGFRHGGRPDLFLPAGATR